MAFKWGLFSPKALDSLDLSTKWLNIWEGSVRSSKTITSLVRWIEYVSQAPAGDLVMTGKTERTLRRNILNPLSEILGSKRFRINQGQGEAYMFGRRIYTVGANDERAITKIQGLTCAGAYCDELSTYPKSFFMMLLSRLSVDRSMLLGTTNPDNPMHYLKTDILDDPELNLISFHFTLDDNLNISDERKADIKRAYVGLWHKRYILGLWVAAEGAIFDNYVDEEHAVDVPKDRYDYLKIWAAIDYGTSAPLAGGLYGKHRDGNDYKISEYYFDSIKAGYQQTDAQYVKELSQWHKSLGEKFHPQYFYVDPSAASFKLELERNGYVVEDANNDVDEGLRYVATRLEQRNFFVDRACENTRKSFQGYVWDPRAQKKGEDKPLHNEASHSMDETRYALFSEYGGTQFSIY